MSGWIGSIEVFRSVRSRGGSADAQGDADAKSLEKGRWIAQNATQYNKGLHQPAAMELEKARNENPDRAVRLDAAACALAHCSASVPTTDKHYDELQALEAAGAGYTRELAELKATGQFDYGYMDSADDFIARHDEAATRTGALVSTGVNTFIGGSSSLGAAATLPGCVSIFGCAVPAGLGGVAAWSFTSAAESASAITGPYVSTEGQRVLSSLNPANNTPDNSALTALARNAAESVAEAIILRGTGKLLLKAYGEGAKEVAGTAATGGAKEVVSPDATGGKKVGPETDLAPEVNLHSDGSYRTPDGKFASPKGLAPPGTVKADEFAKHLEANGMEVVGTEMVVKGPLGDRRYDIVVRDANGKLHGLEVKSGTASKTSYQEFTDYFVNQFGAQGKGRLKGEVIESATTVYVP